MRYSLPQRNADLGPKGSIGLPAIRKKAMNSVTPIRNGSGVQKGGKRSASVRTYRPSISVDRGIDQFHASVEPDGRASNPGEVGIEGEIRGGCPFHKHDPKAHQSISCRGKGYSELAKLNKDHLKVHGLSLERLNADFNFKKKEYASLGTLKEKWRLVYRRLFPKWPKIPYLCLWPTKSRAIEEKAVQDKIVALVREHMQERQSARLQPVDSAVDSMANGSTSVTMDISPSPPVSYEDFFRAIIDDGGYCDQSPRLANKICTDPATYAPAAADSWSFGQALSTEPSSANHQERDIRSQPLAVSTYKVTSLKSVPRSGLPPAPLLQPHAGSAYHGYAPLNVNVSSSPTYGYSLSDHDTTSYPLVEPRNPAQRTPYLSDPIFNSGLSLAETSESLSAVYPSFKGHSHTFTSLSLPSLCLDNANDYLDMENLEHKYEPSIDEGIFFDLEALYSA